jgi:hypothetical protein
MPLGPQIVTFGNIQSSWILSVTLTPVAVASASTVEQSFTINGLTTLDQVQVSAGFAYTGLVTLSNSRISAANTLTLAFTNTTAGSLTPPAGSYFIEVNRLYPGLTMTAIQ